MRATAEQGIDRGRVASASAAAFGATLGVGLVASALPDSSSTALGMGVLAEALNQSLATTGTDYAVSGLPGFRSTPFVFVLAPILATAGAGYLLAPRGQDRLRSALGWATWVAAGYALLLLALSLAVIAVGENRSSIVETTTIEPSPSGVFVHALLWGLLGAGTGAGMRLPQDVRRRAFARARSASVAPALTATRALALSLLVTAALGTAAVVVQTARDVGEIQGKRSQLTASIDSALHVVEHGVHFHVLASGAEFVRSPVPFPTAVPLPVEDVAGAGLADDGDLLDTDFGEGFRIFDYEGPLPGWAFALLASTMLIPVGFAAYGGFQIGRRSPGDSDMAPAARGALVGPVWAGWMLILANIQGTNIFGVSSFGMPDTDSVFVIYLIGGAILGALGGLLAARRDADATPEEGLEPPIRGS